MLLCLQPGEPDSAGVHMVASCLGRPAPRMRGRPRWGADHPSGVTHGEMNSVFTVERQSRNQLAGAAVPGVEIAGRVRR